MTDLVNQNNNNILISVIVPIYNAEKTLRRCLDSILSQSYNNLEIILVNDGSTDGSLDICKEYEQTDKRIVTIDKANEGVSTARNVGLSSAKGDYIAFVDSDDYINSDMYSKLMEAANGGTIDIIFCGYNTVNGNDIQAYYEPKLKDAVEKKDLRYLLLPKQSILGVVWRSLFSKKVIEKVRFDVEIGIAEDLLFLVTCLIKTDKITVIEEKCYNYITSEGKYYDAKFMLDHIKLAKRFSKILCLAEFDSLVAAHNFNRYYNTWMIWLHSNKWNTVLKKDFLRNNDLRLLNKTYNYRCFKKNISSQKEKFIVTLLHYKFYSLTKIIIKTKAKIREITN